MHTDLVDVADVAERQRGREGRRRVGGEIERRDSTDDVVERRVVRRLAHERHCARPEALQVAREAVEQLHRVQDALPVQLQLLARLLVREGTFITLNSNSSATRAMRT